VDLFALGASGTSFVRVLVKLDAGKPLARVVGTASRRQRAHDFSGLV
jgi:hypothetical protein